MENKIMLTESQTSLIDTLKHHKRILSKYRHDIYFPDSSHAESLDFFLSDSDYNFRDFCGKENLPVPEFLIESRWIPLAIDYDYLPDEEKEEWKRKAEEENKNNEELGKCSSLTGFDIWEYEEESFSEFCDVIDKIVEGCDTYLDQLYEKYINYNEDTYDELEEKLEETIFNFFEDEKIKVSKRDIIKMIDDLDLD